MALEQVSRHGNGACSVQLSMYFIVGSSGVFVWDVIHRPLDVASLFSPRWQNTNVAEIIPSQSSNFEADFQPWNRIFTFIPFQFRCIRLTGPFVPRKKILLLNLFSITCVFRDEWFLCWLVFLPNPSTLSCLFWEQWSMSKSHWTNNNKF